MSDAVQSREAFAMESLTNYLVLAIATDDPLIMTSKFLANWTEQNWSLVQEQLAETTVWYLNKHGHTLDGLKTKLDTHIETQWPPVGLDG